MNQVQISMLILVFIFTLFLLISLKIKSKKQSKKSPVPHSRQDAKISEDSKKTPIIISEKHKKYRDISYNIICNDEIFNDHEFDILTEYGSWLNALASEKIEPETDSQREFIKHCKNNQNLPLSEMLKDLKNINPKTNKIQFIWFKYLCRIQAEKEDPEFIKNRRQAVSATNEILKIRRIHEIEIEIASLQNNEQRKTLVKILERELARLKT